MLRYGLRYMDGVTLNVPCRVAERPDRAALAARYEKLSDRLADAILIDAS